MEAITLESITNLTINKTAKFHTTSIAYVQKLLHPYAKSINEAIAIDSIIKWIPLIASGGLGEGAINVINKDIESYDIEHEDIEQEDINLEQRSKELAQISKINVIRYIIEQIWDICEKISGDIYPWDLNSKISENEDLANMFSITSENKTLPISVIINNVRFEHAVTEEFVSGLFLFSHVKGLTFNTSMFEIPIEIDYLKSVQSKIKYDEKYSFSVKIAHVDYGFNTPDFMRGFVTGALWTRDHHRLYWSELLSHSINESNEHMTSAITF